MRNYLLPLIQNMYIDFIKTKKEYKKLLFFLIHSIYRNQAVVEQGCCLQDVSFTSFCYSSLLQIITFFFWNPGRGREGPMN